MGGGGGGDSVHHVWQICQESLENTITVKNILKNGFNNCIQSHYVIVEVDNQGLSATLNEIADMVGGGRAP